MTVGERRPSGAPRPRGTANQARWDEVLEAAAEVFSERGYPSATVQDIAARVGMLKGSLYYYIDSKEDLLYEILRRSHLEGISYIQEDPATSRSAPPVRMASLIRRWMAGLETLPPVLRVSEFDFRYLEGERRAEILSLRRRIASGAEGIIAAGVAEGCFDGSVDPRVAASTLFRVLNTVGSWYRPAGAVSWEDLTEWVVRLFVGGLRAGPLPLPD